ncbi:MAG: dUTP diphosphatase [Alistipes sp.]|nr:dUTP diphosphatase [Alistipes sp.]
MEVKIKRLTDTAKLPTKAHATDAGYDLYANMVLYSPSENQITYGTGVAVEIPEGYVGLVFPRSSICKKHLSLSNAVGVIDSGYRGEILAKFNILPDVADAPRLYEVGDRIAQLIIIPYPEIEFVEVDALADSDRGEGGYGSSGR